jgi:uncharacterized membrane protein YqaE (UPF0057 family)
MASVDARRARARSHECLCPCLCCWGGLEGICLAIVAVLLPPLGVACVRGTCTAPFWVCVLLTLLGWFPGQVYAVYIVCTDRRIVESEANMVADVV